MTTETKSMTVTVPQPVEVQARVTATTLDEMVQAQTGMIEWFECKIMECQEEEKEAVGAYEHAVSRKWSSSSLKRIADRAAKRTAFYTKVLEALRNGFIIIPNFPVTAFAIRTDKKRPLKMMTTNKWAALEQESQARPIGEGEYKNPFPSIWQRTIEKATQTTSEVKQYWAEAWKALEFPLSMARPQIMEAATRAMALKIFDDLAILPETRTKGDPMILARIFDASDTNTGRWRRHVTFLVAWHLDLRAI